MGQDRSLEEHHTADQTCQKPLELVTSAKLLGMIISHDLKWNTHTSELSRKCSSRQLKRSGVSPGELVLFYVTGIRPVLEYASPVFHSSLPNYISEDLEWIQRRALRIIYPDLSYSVALETAGLPKLYERKEKISTDLFDEPHRHHGKEKETHEGFSLVSRSSYSFACARAVNISWYFRHTFAACDWF